MPDVIAQRSAEDHMKRALLEWLLFHPDGLEEMANAMQGLAYGMFVRVHGEAFVAATLSHCAANIVRKLPAEGAA